MHVRLLRITKLALCARTQVRESTSSGKALSAKYLERNISVLRSLLLLQARREGNDEEKTLLKDEPEMVKLYDAYATAMREVDRIRTDARQGGDNKGDGKI